MIRFRTHFVNQKNLINYKPFNPNQITVRDSAIDEELARDEKTFLIDEEVAMIELIKYPKVYI